MSVINKILYPFILVGSLIGQEFRIVEDNWDWEIDKRAHYLTSFGLYYASYVLCEGLCTDSTHDNVSLSLVVSSGIGLVYEIYQGYHWREHGGFSKHDLGYNLLGILTGYTIHRFFLYIKEIL